MVKCCACGSTEVEPVTSIPFLDSRVREHQLAFFACVRCGTVSHDNDEFLPAGHYERGCYASPHRASALDRTEAFLDEHLGALGESKRVLEVGCATGRLLARLQGRGCRVAGVELSRPARETAASRGLEVVSSLDELGGGSFDVLLFCHMIEHVTEPAALMGEYLRLLDDGGAVFVEVPSIDRLAAGAASSYDNLYPHHRHHFSVTGLIALLEGLGCSPVALDHHAQAAYPSLLGLFCKADAGRAGRKHFVAHVDHERSRAREIAAVLCERMKTRRHLVVWGCADEAYKVLLELPPAVLEQTDLVDAGKDKIGKTLLGKTIQDPRLLSGRDGVLLFIAPTTPSVSDEIHAAAVALLSNGSNEIIRNKRVNPPTP